MKKAFPTLVFLLLVPAFCPGLLWAADNPQGGSTRLSISEAADAALRSSRGLKGLDALGSVEEAKRSEAETMLMPRAEVASSAMAGNNPVFVFGSLLEQSDFTADRFQIRKLNDPNPVTNVRTNFNVQLPLYDGGQRSVALEQAKLGGEAVKKQRESAEQALRLATVRGYFGLHLAREREAATVEAIRAAEADLKRAKDLFDAGMIVRSDLLALEVQLAELNQQAIEAKGETSVATEGLNTLVGLPENSSPELSTPLSPKVFDLPDQGTVSGTARANRREIALADIDIKRAGEGVRAARTQYEARVEAFGNYGISSEAIGVDSTDWTVGVRLTFPLMDFGRSKRLDQANAAQAGAKFLREAKMEQASLEALSSYKRFAAARERMEVASKAVDRAVEAHRIVGERYQAGLTTVAEVLRAENSVLRSRLGESSARYALYVGYAEFLHASGTLASVAAFE